MGGVSGTLMQGVWAIVEGLRQGNTWARQRFPSRNIRHEQSVGHSLLKISDHPCFAAGDRDCQRLARSCSELSSTARSACEARQTLAARRRLAARFRTIQVYPKDLRALPGHPEPR